MFTRTGIKEQKPFFLILCRTRDLTGARKNAQAFLSNRVQEMHSLMLRIKGAESRTRLTREARCEERTQQPQGPLPYLI